LRAQPEVSTAVQFLGARERERAAYVVGALTCVLHGGAAAK
jgi:hypothetical protein